MADIQVDVEIKLEGIDRFIMSHKKAVKKGVTHIYNNVKRNIGGSGKIANALQLDYQYEKGYAWIGFPSGSHEELVGSVLQYGSGAMGETYYKPTNFGEKKPQYTNPILPIKGKAMMYVNKNGQKVFMKSFKGHKPKYIMTEAVKNSLRFMPIIISNEMNK